MGAKPQHNSTRLKPIDAIDHICYIIAKAEGQTLAKVIQQYWPLTYYTYLLYIENRSIESKLEQLRLIDLASYIAIAQSPKGDLRKIRDSILRDNSPQPESDWIKKEREIWSNKNK